MMKAMNFWPPFVGAGIRVTRITPDFRHIDVEMKKRFWNANYVGTQYGGSLYSMCDPFYMLMVIEILGPDYIVWDKFATIRFRKPGRGIAKASFSLTDEKINEIKSQTSSGSKAEPEFLIQVLDSGGEVVCEVTKTLYVKLKDGK